MRNGDKHKSDQLSKKKITEKKSYTLPNGLSILHINKQETDFVYKEIFEEQIYLKHGITIHDGDCIFDIGANIGLFSLSLLQKYKNINLYAFEPSPELYEILRLNTASHAPHIKTFQCGISSENKEAVFTFYPNYSILSGFDADLVQDRETLKSGLRTIKPAQNEFEDEIIDELVKEKLSQKREYTCQLKTVANIVEQYNIQSIDLLKIDAEKSELNVLKGIQEKNWPKIKQIVMEVHDAQGRMLNEITSLLIEKGFRPKIEKEKQLVDSGIANIYALRHTKGLKRKQQNSRNTSKKKENKKENTQKQKRERIAISATFTAEPLLKGLKFWMNELELRLDIQFAPYNQVFQELLSPESSLLSNRYGMNVILLRFDDWLRYRKRENSQTKRAKQKTVTAKERSHLEATLNEFIDTLQTYNNLSSCFSLLILCPPSPVYAHIPSSLSLFEKLEKKLESSMEGLNGLSLIKASDFHSLYQIEESFDSLGDEIGHVPYTTHYFNFLATLIMRYYYSAKNIQYKVIILDCDDTLWDGVCGEVGSEGIKIEGIFRKFQDFLVKKSEQGFLLCLCSKNSEEDVWKVFEEQAAMVLRKEHIVDSRINWQQKSENIRSLARGLNLGIDSFIYFDDNPMECAEVRFHCPEALTVQWPIKKREGGILEHRILEHIWMLDKFSVTEEDERRRESYQANVKREELRQKSYGFHDFIENLRLDIKIGLMDETHLPRVSQLTNRTNQFNFTTIRRTPHEIRKLLDENGHECRTVEVSDRFGDYGIVGVMIVKRAKDILELDTFLLSCRVLGRGVEHRMMAELGEIAKEKHLPKVKIVYKKSAKNEPARQFLEQLAKKYAIDKKNNGMEFLIPAEDLASVTYKPQKRKKTSKGEPIEAHSVQKGTNSFGSIRKKEALLVRIATQLSTMKDLSREIEAFHLKNRGPDASKESFAYALSEMIGRGADEEDIADLVMNRVKKIFARALLLTPGELDSRANIETYLNDSLKIVEITTELNREFGNIPAPFLFEHRTLKSISDSIIENNRQIAKAKEQTRRRDEKKAGRIWEKKKASQDFDHEREVSQARSAYLSQPQDERIYGEDIAIIGISGIYPQAKTIDEFWENLKRGVSSITEVPKDRWDIHAFFDATKKSAKSYCKWGGFIDDVDRFEASFFHISPREAETMDPQQRLFLEVVWKLLEDAGYTPNTLGKETGVFVGVIASDYNTYTDEAALKGVPCYRNSEFYQIPNRISYFFDFHGPSLAVDTACSSSGAALHLACKSLKQKECETAIVGGINLLLHPSRFIQYSQMGTLAPDNRCKPFGEGANGTLLGEGIGALLLKPLGKAVKERDNIYAVIKGSAINSGGKTNGFTVPDPQAQAELISRALKNARVDPRSISYVEAHGTGTSLGDPIEIRGLTKAFREDRSRRDKNPTSRYCAIGSIKSNIGHLESAAAVAGAIKIVLQMKHGLFVPSLNASNPNPLIPFDQTPFYVQCTAGEWKRPTLMENGRQITYPRRAGLSSFGAGGVNTHFVLEEYRSHTMRTEQEQGPHIIVISAQDDQRLKAYIAELLQFLKKRFSSSCPADKEGGHVHKTGRSDITLADIAYTLQAGRLPMDERLSVVTACPKELIEKLSQYCEGKASIKNLYTGNVKSKRKTTELLVEGREGKEFLNIIIKEKKLKKLAQLWVCGVEIDWRLLYQTHTPTRVSLPTHTFIGERYWLPEVSIQEGGAGSKEAKDTALHPLLDSNESTFHEQCFQKVFSEADIFLKDHVVNGLKILPGVVYLEMARISGNLSNRNSYIRSIHNIVWIRPIVLSKPTQEVLISLFSQKNTIHCRVTTPGEDGQRLVHAECNMNYEEVSKKEHNAEWVDIDSLRDRFSASLTKAECYELLQTVGYSYGSAYQIIQELSYSSFEGFSRLELPEELEHEYDKFALHPSLMDAALQTVSCWMRQIEEMPPHPHVPYTIGDVEIIHPLKKMCYAYATTASHRSSNSSPVKKYDVSILDADGRILVKIKDYYPRPFQQTPASTNLAEAPVPIYFKSLWERSTIGFKGSSSSKNNDHYLVFDKDEEIRNALIEHLNAEKAQVILVKPGKRFQKRGEVYEINPECEDDYSKLLLSLQSQKRMPERILHVWSQKSLVFDPEVLTSQLSLGFYSLFFLSKGLMKQKPKNEIRIVYVYLNSSKEPQPQHAAVSGMVRSIHRENPRLIFKTVDMDSPNIEPSQLVKTVVQEFRSGQNGMGEIKYREKQRFIKRFVEFDLDREIEEGKPLEKAGALKKKGVYLITGGAGGLGFIVAEYLVRSVRARLVLTGRSDLTADKQKKIDALRALGSEVTYFKADVSRPEDVKNLIAQSKSVFKRIDGIIHSAGAIRDSLVVNKTLSEIHEVIAPKVFGALILDRETADENLDFFLMFSSISASIGNLGQTDYAYANRFLDEFVAVREGLRKKQKRIGRTLSINWPWWRDGGMSLEDSTVELLERSMGLKGIETSLGLKVLGKGLHSNLTQFMLIFGHRKKIAQIFDEGKKPHKEKDEALKTPPIQIDKKELVQKIQNDLGRMIFTILKTPQESIDFERSLGEFGFDSMSFTSFANLINERYNLDVSPTNFYEHPSLSSFASYLLTEYKDTLAHHYDLRPNAPTTDDASIGAKEEITEMTGGGFEKTRSAHHIQELSLSSREVAKPFSSGPVAIIGMSGVFPQSENLETFWKHLEEGKDLITEIPKNRWNWQEYYGHPMEEMNKTDIKWGGFLKEVDKFDALFFGISPREAELMDPQQRIFLETVWKTIEDAGYRPSGLSGTKTGLFVGVSIHDYDELMMDHGIEIEAHTSTGVCNSIISNRVSYLFDLHGPSESIDTACSSSLIAIHRGVECIRSGRCDLAIAGGVNVILRPKFHISMRKAGMLSEDGRCMTFDKRANGYVRGEGAGAVLLKPLKSAVADGDHIYAIIRGTAENHAGRTQSLTAPNPNAQADVLIHAYNQSRMSPDTVSYIETHGTGTSLGDPIEVEGLKKAFGSLYESRGKPLPKEKHCGIGSVKTNIGHLESAAGIASVIKVLLAMKHKRLPASIHFKELNPHIQLKESPFYVVNRTTPWECLTDENEQPLPRRAGVSSFGFGGVNAHIVLEEYQGPSARIGSCQEAPQIFVLSAKNEERLKSYAKNMADFFERVSSVPQSEISLSDTAYTMRVGRDAMSERLAGVVSSMKDLAKKLSRFCEGKEKGLYRGSIQTAAAQSELFEGEEAEAFIRNIIENKRLHKIAQLWVSGAHIDWSIFHQNRRSRRVPLPTYPFSRERYWISESSGHTKILREGEEGFSRLHPMIDHNISTLKQLQFTTQLSGKEFYLYHAHQNHRGAETKVVPGLAFLEMARAAGEIAGEAKVRCMRNIAWAKSATVESAPREIRIELYPNHDDVEYEISSLDDNDQIVVYSQGVLVYETDSLKERPTELIDLGAIKKGCSESMTGTECYDLFHRKGGTRKPVFRSIQEVHLNAKEALSRIELPVDSPHGMSELVLHPTVMEAGFQTLIMLMHYTEDESSTSFLPFRLDQTEIVRPLPETSYVYVAQVFDPNSPEHGKDMFDIRFLNARGTVLASMKSLSLKRLKHGLASNRHLITGGVSDKKEKMLSSKTFSSKVFSSIKEKELEELVRMLETGEITAAEADLLTKERV